MKPIKTILAYLCIVAMGIAMLGGAPARDKCGGGKTWCTCSGSVTCWPGNASRPEDFTICPRAPVPVEQTCPTLRASLESECARAARAKVVGPVKIVCAQDLTCAEGT